MLMLTLSQMRGQDICMRDHYHDVDYMLQCVSKENEYAHARCRSPLAQVNMQ